MQINQSAPKPLQALLKLFLCFLFLIPFVAISQTTYLPQDAEENILIERIEIKLQKDSIFNFSKTKPYSREAIIPAIKNLYDRHAYAYSKRDVARDTTVTDFKFSAVDGYNMRRALMNSLEWTNDIGSYKSRRPWGKTFYQTPGTLYEVH